VRVQEANHVRDDRGVAQVALGLGLGGVWGGEKSVYKGLKGRSKGIEREKEDSKEVCRGI
jgi:hypothetical protein